MKRKSLRNKRYIKRENGKTKRNPSRKIYTQEKIAPHLVNMMKPTRIKKRYYLWLRKIKQETLIVLKKKEKSI
jgi:hypothetical protein